jgi:hypothetical protein
MKRALLVATGVILTACGGSKSNPTGPDQARVLQGQTVSAIDGSSTGVVNVQVGTHFTVQTDPNGNFQVDLGGQGTYATTISGVPIVERHTAITGPSADRMKITLIPSSFDLKAFDEMFRQANNRLQRWTSRPSLVVVASVMKYVNGNTDQYEVTGEKLTDDEVTALVGHLTEGLTLLTGGTFTSFGAVDVERPDSGSVNVRRTGKIVVGRYTGVTTIASTIGYGTWAEQPDGTVVGGTIWLDRDFDKNDSRRRLLRMHELGHALGYLHVTVRTSLMNPSIGPEPTDFDRGGAMIAFQRPVGNTSPDNDPTGARTFSIAEGTARWRDPIR